MAAGTLRGFCLSLSSFPSFASFSPSASRLSYSFSAAKVKCRSLPVRSEGAQGYLASTPSFERPPPTPSCLHLTLWQQCLLLASRLAPPTGVVEECVYPLLSASGLLSSRTRYPPAPHIGAEKGPPCHFFFFCRMAAAVSSSTSERWWSRVMISDKEGKRAVCEIQWEPGGA